MIPNALLSGGPYAGLWSHLKTIDHAIARIMAAESSKDITELDRERLLALTSLLESSLKTNAETGDSVQQLQYSEDAEPNYGSAIDLRGRIASIDDFTSWQKTSKSGIDKKLARLVHVTKDFVNNSSEGLFPKVPLEEFRLLRKIVQGLLADAETALHE